MSKKSPCPDEQTIQKLLGGQISAVARNSFADHLEKCDPCAETMERLLDGDTLLGAMRAQARVVELPPAALVACLVGRLGGLRPDSPGPTPPTHKTPPDNTGSVDGLPPLNCLAPPQRSDEIGRLGRYRVLEVLGRGGMGIVFLAEDEPLQRLVALKLMNQKAARTPAAKERFLREARAAAALEHEHIVTIFQVGEENGVPFLAMQLLKGMSLEERLNLLGGLSVPEMLRLGRQVARGLAVAHERGLIHRDIKPANIWLEDSSSTPDSSAPRAEFGKVKLLDFGLVLSLQDDQQRRQKETLVGTPLYMAPEQARGEKGDHRSDLFSLGVVLYRLCTGRLPFCGDGTTAVIDAVLNNQPQPVRELNPDVPQPPGRPGNGAHRQGAGTTAQRGAGSCRPAEGYRTATNGRPAGQESPGQTLTVAPTGNRFR